MRFSTASLNTVTAAVVGAGPAGVAAVGQLLESGVAKPVSWIDPSFTGGRLQRYREVPSNTNVSLFMAYGEACQAFGGRGNPSIAHFESLPKDRGCQLGLAQELITKLSSKLRGLQDVDSIQGSVTRIEQVNQQLWRLSAADSAMSADTDKKQHQEHIVQAEKVFLATGSHPRTASDIGAPHLQYSAGLGVPPPTELDLEVALSPANLQQIITPQDEVAIVGSSHSAVLALKNLTELPPNCRPKRIVNFYRSPLQYAEYRDDEHGQWILRDNTGLKGSVAEWAKLHCESPEAKWRVPGLQRVCMYPQQEKAFGRALPGCTKIFYAVGYKRNPVPEIVVDGHALPQDDIAHDPLTGQLIDKRHNAVLQGLYGCGIAFPELWTDPFGNKELAVGMFKFMKYMQKAVPAAVCAA